MLACCCPLMCLYALLTLTLPLLSYPHTHLSGCSPGAIIIFRISVATFGLKRVLTFSTFHHHELLSIILLIVSVSSSILVAFPSLSRLGCLGTQLSDHSFAILLSPIHHLQPLRSLFLAVHIPFQVYEGLWLSLESKKVPHGKYLALAIL